MCCPILREHRHFPCRAVPALRLRRSYADRHGHKEDAYEPTIRRGAMAHGPVRSGKLVPDDPTLRDHPGCRRSHPLCSVDDHALKYDRMWPSVIAITVVELFPEIAIQAHKLVRDGIVTNRGTSPSTQSTCHGSTPEGRRAAHLQPCALRSVEGGPGHPCGASVRAATTAAGRGCGRPVNVAHSSGSLRTKPIHLAPSSSEGAGRGLCSGTREHRLQTRARHRPPPSPPCCVRFMTATCRP
jgi:hypothetical protein